MKFLSTLLLTLTLAYCTPSAEKPMAAKPAQPPTRVLTPPSVAQQSLSATAVQSAHGNTGSVTTATSLALTISAPVVGNTLVMAVCTNSSQGLSIVQTNVVWTLYPAFNGGGLTFVWLAVGKVNLASPGTTITLSIASGAAFVCAAVVAEYSGVNMQLDVGGSGIGNTSSTTVTTATSNYPNEIVFGALGCRGQYTATHSTIFSNVANGFTIVDQDNTNVNTANTDKSAALLVKVVSATGAHTPAATPTPAPTNWGAVGAAFREVQMGFFYQ